MIPDGLTPWNSQCTAQFMHNEGSYYLSLSLVFMGSEKYPLKGLLDHLANRGFSNGTNAWTDTDHTAYTVGTAGSQGFLQLLPVYLDHILYPTLQKSAFITEVRILILKMIRLSDARPGSPYRPRGTRFRSCIQ